MNPVTLTLDIPKQWWMTSNSRLYWADKATRTRNIRRLAALTARSQSVSAFPCRVRVTATIHGRTRTAFDPGNTEPTVKPILDGLVDAGVLVDDNHRYVTGPEYAYGDPIPQLASGYHRVALTLTPEKETPQ